MNKDEILNVAASVLRLRLELGAAEERFDELVNGPKPRVVPKSVLPANATKSEKLLHVLGSSGNALRLSDIARKAGTSGYTHELLRRLCANGRVRRAGRGLYALNGSAL